MRASDEFHDLLFELSNENRYGALIILREEPKRITDLTRLMNLTTTEVRRNVTRLSEAGLIQRDLEGYYHITPYGETALLFLLELDFLSSFKEYFKTHAPQQVPPMFLKQMGKLRESEKISSPVDFFRLTQNLLREADDHVWIMVDQFPVNLLTTIVETIERGVKIKIIEPRERVLEPDLDALTSEENRAYNMTHSTPLYEQGMFDNIPMQLYVSESHCVISFPNQDGKYDYTGITSFDESALDWCNDLFEHIWAQSVSRDSIEAAPVQVKGNRVSKATGSSGKIKVIGHENPEADAKAVQDAVNNYDEIILSGVFNFGSSSIWVTRSVVIKGEGRVDDIPSTRLYKMGWVFPFHVFTSVFELEGDGIDVTIENLYFMNYNCSSIECHRYNTAGNCNSVKFLNNRITIPNGYGRGITTRAFGDFFHGVYLDGVRDGGVLIEGNYIDLDLSTVRALSRGGLEDDPEYRPDLLNHENYVGFGIYVSDCSGKVEILNNVVRNANGRGIVTMDHDKPIDVIIRGNVIESEVYGTYPMSSLESGSGILAHTGFEKDLPGFSVFIEENTIKLEKLNHSGIIVLGPLTEGSGKLSGVIRGNQIHLNDGYEGIRVRKCDNFDVTDNKLSGKAYYGIKISGRKSDELDHSAMNNVVENNDMKSLTIKKPDLYVNNHSDGKMFSKSEPRTAYLWLDQYTKKNQIKITEKENMINEGENNTITKSPN